jgi:hypothetical protein
VRFARRREVAAAVRADASIEPRILTRPPAEPDIYPD